MDTSVFLRNVLILEKAYDFLIKNEQCSVDYEIYCSACIKQVELILDISVSILYQHIKTSVMNEYDAEH